jgi:hypothetical protein
MTLDHPKLSASPLRRHNGKEIGTATVLDTHSLKLGDEIGGYRIVRVRPETTREVRRVDVVKISENDDAQRK